MARASHLDSSGLNTTIREKAGGIRRRLLNWFPSNHRIFRWREDTSAYVVLISEILLKKTTAQAVDRFLPSFLERYPDVKSLSGARIADLRHTLQPLGLSQQRATQLHALARAVSSCPGGRIPCSRDELLLLPGVGPYTANSILCVAFGTAAPIVDTNVARILTRVFGVNSSTYEPRRCPVLWAIAAAVAGKRSDSARRANWALLDLGAMVCISRTPRCAICPLRPICSFATTNAEADGAGSRRK